MPDRRRKRPRDPAPARQADDRYCLSDGHKAYLEAVEGAFGSDIDYAMLVVPENSIRAARAITENQSIIRRDACHPPSAWNICRQPVQVAAPA